MNGANRVEWPIGNNISGRTRLAFLYTSIYMFRMVDSGNLLMAYQFGREPNARRQ